MLARCSHVGGRLHLGLFALAVGLLFSACAPRTVAESVARTAPVSGNAVTERPGDNGAQLVALHSGQQGMASWYGPGFAGRRTANGEIFDPSQLTAAHKELPFNTLVRVHNLDNGSSVVVRINDRGPFVHGRIIDLSRAGAEAIGMIGSGTARVRLEPITLPAGFVRVGATGGLRGFEVLSRAHAIGTLLVLEPTDGGESVVVRVVGQDVPSETGADILVGLELYARVGAEVKVLGG